MEVNNPLESPHEKTLNKQTGMGLVESSCAMGAIVCTSCIYRYT